MSKTYTVVDYIIVNEIAFCVRTGSIVQPILLLECEGDIVFRILQQSTVMIELCGNKRTIRVNKKKYIFNSTLTPHLNSISSIYGIIIME